MCKSKPTRLRSVIEHAESRASIPLSNFEEASMGIRFLKIAAVYLFVGVAMGLAMGITQSFALHPVHAHVNLLGWASLALAGLIYVQFPAAAETRLARIHFWMHNVSLPIFMTALAFLLSGH